MEQLTTGQQQFAERFPALADRVTLHGSGKEASQLFWAYELATAGLKGAGAAGELGRAEEYKTLIASLESRLIDILTPVTAWGRGAKASA